MFCTRFAVQSAIFNDRRRGKSRPVRHKSDCRSSTGDRSGNGVVPVVIISTFMVLVRRVTSIPTLSRKISRNDHRADGRPRNRRRMRAQRRRQTHAASGQNSSIITLIGGLGLSIAAAITNPMPTKPMPTVTPAFTACSGEYED